jgi:uncharacterized protein YcfL
VIDLMKKVFLGLMAALLLAGAAGCSQSSDKKMNDKQTNSGKMKMTDEEMKNMKSDDKK